MELRSTAVDTYISSFFSLLFLSLVPFSNDYTLDLL